MTLLRSRRWVPLDWTAFHADTRRHRVGLPTYPFERTRHWIAAAQPSRAAAPRTAQPSEVSEENPRAEAALPAPGARPVERGTPTDGVERALSEIWQEALGIRQVGAGDDFFELGGNSLLAVQVVGRVRRLWGVKLSVRDLFAAPTISRFAQRIEAASISTHAPAGAGSPGNENKLQEALKHLEYI
jgi:phthiocerol/phenolphthiocerol synthesis type-I polyketide synthase E